jgi:excisionase family DNA binding protein
LRTHYTTSQVAKLLSVSSDTVLKWVKAGKISSYRTPGGHCRIPAEAVAALLPAGEQPVNWCVAAPRENPFLHCWDYYSGPEGVGPECQNCIAYRSGARRCYEMREIPEEFGPLKLFCQTDCTDCDFYRLTHSQGLSILMISRNRRWLRSLSEAAETAVLNLAVATCEYESGATIARFRPDFVVVDLALGTRRARNICRHVQTDARIPFTRIILTSGEARWAEDCHQDFFGWIRKPFDLDQLQEFVAGTVHPAATGRTGEPQGATT